MKKETNLRLHQWRWWALAFLLVHAASFDCSLAFGDESAKSAKFELVLEGAIGLRLGGPDVLRIADVFPDTPAWKAGLRQGDRILSVDRVPAQDLSVQQLMEKIRGRTGTIVIIEVEQAATRNKKTFEITRSVIRVPAS